MISAGAATCDDLARTEAADAIVDDAQAILKVTNQLHTMLALNGDFLDTTM